MRGLLERNNNLPVAVGLGLAVVGAGVGYYLWTAEERAEKARRDEVLLSDGGTIFSIHF